jgi:hypothetical protein
MDTRNPKRSYTIESTTQTANENATTESETVNQPIEKLQELEDSSSPDSKKNSKPVERHENGRRNDQKSKNTPLKNLMKVLGVKPLDKNVLKNMESSRLSASEKQRENIETDGNLEVTGFANPPFQRKPVNIPKGGVIDRILKRMEQSKKQNLESANDKDANSNDTAVVPVNQDPPTSLVPKEQVPPVPTDNSSTAVSGNPLNDIHINFQYHYTTIRNSAGNIRIDHPIQERHSKRDEDDEDDEDYDPEDDEDGDEEDEEDDYEVKGLPKDTYYDGDETDWFKAAPEEVQKKILEDENKLAKLQSSETPLRFRVLQSPHLSDRSKVNIIQMINDMTNASPFGNDSSKATQRMSLLSKIPFDTYLKPTITREHTPEEIGKYLVSVKDTMDKAVFGHANAKQQIISILAREISNPKSVGNVFAIQGPMGNGKTTLAKEGICKAMNRPFAFISLGGMQDSAFFTGHSYTYEGSKPGRIVEILIETGCMNPVIYFDELDKVSETKHGEEIIHMLCHLTDTTQNSLFQDKYFSGIEFDLSKATFIFSYNDESRINPILLDRMIKIRTDGFDNESKMIIAKKYLLPGLRTQFNFSETDVVFSDEVIKHIMSNYTNDEKGVRNLKRCLDATLSKCNILRYIPSEQQKEMGLAVKGFKLPWTVTIDNIKDFIEKDKSERNPILDMLYL